MLNNRAKRRTETSVFNAYFHERENRGGGSCSTTVIRWAIRNCFSQFSDDPKSAIHPPGVRNQFLRKIQQIARAESAAAARFCFLPLLLGRQASQVEADALACSHFRQQLVQHPGAPEMLSGASTISTEIPRSFSITSASRNAGAFPRLNWLANRSPACIAS